MQITFYMYDKYHHLRAVTIQKLYILLYYVPIHNFFVCTRTNKMLYADRVTIRVKLLLRCTLLCSSGHVRVTVYHILVLPKYNNNNNNIICM